MKVILRNPDRVVELPGRRRVKEVLKELGINPETVLTIRGSTLLTGEVMLEEGESLEIRPVVSGG